MSEMPNTPPNNSTMKSIEDAIERAAGGFCQNVAFVQFNPWERGFMTESSHQRCYKFFKKEIAGIRPPITKNQHVSEMIVFASTRGWLYGYSCAQVQADRLLSNKKKQITGLKCDLKTANTALEQKKDEADQLRDDLESKKDELRRLKSKEEGKNFPKPSRFKSFYVCLGIIAAVAIAIITTDWPI